jgi:protocatechuate 3,4-dioxygenase beta subunit
MNTMTSTDEWHSAIASTCHLPADAARQLQWHRTSSSGDMTMKLATPASRFLFIVLGSLFFRESLSQADPFWVRSWNEAQQSRPEQMSSVGRIASATEPGIPMVVEGQVVQPDGRTPAHAVVVHAYHRDHHGFDFGPNDRALTTWRLQGWVRTDAQGRFEFRTIRPAPDHMGRAGAHIHFTVESRTLGRQWAPTVYFADDPLVSNKTRQQSADAGEFGWVRDVKVDAGLQRTNVKIRLKEQADF